MGSQVNATCRCGVDTSILIGGGMDDFLSTCLFPCLCGHCHSVVQVNLLAKPLQCPQCKTATVIPYDDPALTEYSAEPSSATWKSVFRWGGGKNKSPEQRIVASWNVKEPLGRSLDITDGNYRCPRCGQMTLQFSDTGLRWD
jgi:hypothetical protein